MSPEGQPQSGEKKVAAPRAELPSETERLEALADMERGNFGKMKSFLERQRDWSLEAGQSTFNEETFIKGYQEREGKVPDNALIERVRAYSEGHKKGYLREAQEAAKALEDIKSLEGGK